MYYENERNYIQRRPYIMGSTIICEDIKSGHLKIMTSKLQKFFELLAGKFVKTIV